MDERLAGRDARESGADSTMPDDEKHAVLAFSAVAGIGEATLRALKTIFGSLAAALKTPRHALIRHLKSIEAQKALHDADSLDKLADRVRRRTAEAGAGIVFPGDPLWPRRLSDENAPPLLFFKGNLAALNAPSLAVVGSRRSDSYGLKVTEFWAGEAARRGVLIVSGGAIGVDSQAHRAAMDAGGQTAAVFGTGIDGTYPPSHGPLFRRIVQENGLLISPFQPGTAPKSANFIRRNHLIAALTDVTLITRASDTSGALSTARAASEMNKPIFAVPGDLDAPLSAGIRLLIDSNLARPAFGLEPVGRALGIAGPWPVFAASAALSAPPSLAAHAPKLHRADASSPPLHRDKSPQLSLPSSVSAASLPEKLSSIFKKLGAQPCQFDELLAQTGLDAAALADALLQLELQGLCEELPGRLFRRPPSG